MSFVGETAGLEPQQKGFVSFVKPVPGEPRAIPTSNSPESAVRTSPLLVFFESAWAQKQRLFMWCSMQLRQRRLLTNHRSLNPQHVYVLYTDERQRGRVVRYHRGVTILVMVLCASEKC